MNPNNKLEINLLIFVLFCANMSQSNSVAAPKLAHFEFHGEGFQSQINTVEFERRHTNIHKQNFFLTAFVYIVHQKIEFFLINFV